MDAQIEIDPNFEPQTRVRSNTWPCRPREVLQDAQCSPVSDESTSDGHHHDPDHIKSDGLGLAKKTSSRRNAWGNLSYADLITKAIQSSPEQRLTLSQIYDWMVQNVPYFKDKGDSTSSAGWKNSIRHNLSLHSRFMRIQNEGTGKSSWWVLNPDAKPGKTPRRRAGSMETKSYEKRRGRVRKKVDALRALENSNSPTSTTGDFTDSPLSFQLSPEFRPRASSNASSCGRLSPIQAGIEPDLHDSQVPPMSPIPWGSELDSTDGYDTLGQSDGLVDVLLDSMKLADRNNLSLSDNAGGINLMEQGDIEMLADSGLQQQLMSSNNGHLTELSSLSQYNEQSANFDNAQFRNLPAPPAYPGDSIRHQSPNPQGLEQMTLQNGGNGVYRDISDIALQGRPSNMGMYSQPNSVYSPQEAMMLQARISPASSQLSVNTQSPQLTSPSRSPQGHQQISPNYGNQGNYSGPNQQSPQDKQMSPQQLASRQVAAASSQQQRSLLQQCLEAPPSESLLRAALTQKNQAYQMSLSQSTQSYSSPPPPPPPQYSNIRYDGQQMNARLASPSQQRQMPTMNSNNINNNIISAQSVNRNLSMLSGGGILQQSRQQQQRNMVGQNISDVSMSQLQTGMATTGGQLSSSTSMAGNNSGNSLNEINDTVNFDDLSVEEILNYELTCEGNLDFTETFDPVNNSVTTSADTQNLVR